MNMEGIQEVFVKVVPTASVLLRWPSNAAVVMSFLSGYCVADVLHSIRRDREAKRRAQAHMPHARG